MTVHQVFWWLQQITYVNALISKSTVLLDFDKLK